MKWITRERIKIDRTARRWLISNIEKTRFEGKTNNEKNYE